jgi:hypothetical protein
MIFFTCFQVQPVLVSKLIPETPVPDLIQFQSPRHQNFQYENPKLLFQRGKNYYKGLINVKAIENSLLLIFKSL